MIDEKALEILGLNKNLTTLYLAILKGGGLSASQLAETTGLSRTNVYALAEQLVAEKLVGLDFEGSKKRFTARDPGEFRENVAGRLQELDRLMPELKALHQAGTVKPKISYYEGPDGVRQVMDDLLTVRDDHYCYFGSIAGQMTVEGSAEAQAMVRRRVRLGIRSRSIRPREPGLAGADFPADEKALREVRYFPGPIPPDIPSLFIYDQRLAILSSAREHYALIIESQELADLVRFIWEMVWSISED